MVGLYDDNPPGGPFAADSQLRDGAASGTRFDLSGGALAIAEAQYTATLLPLFGGKELPGTYKLGGWADSGVFSDQRFDAAGLSLADPASSGVAAMHRGDFSLYALADQTLWKTETQTLGIFARLMGAPGDRNLVDLGFDAGVNLAGPLPGRDKDSVGLAYGVAKISGAAAALARDEAAFSGMAVPSRAMEQFIELTYQVQVTGWWVVQPDLQFILNPGGGLPNPDAPSQRIGNELVAGMQTKITF